jgi:excisionase family DNA binding protein
MNKLMTISEVADSLHVSVACLRRWVLLRRINTIRIGRLVRISPQEVQRIVDQGLIPARSERGGRRAE